MVTIASQPVQPSTGIFAEPLRLVVTTTNEDKISAVRQAFKLEGLANPEITSWEGDSKFEFMPTRRRSTTEAVARTRVMLALGSPARHGAAFILGLHIGISPLTEPPIEEEKLSEKLPWPSGKEPAQWGLAAGAFLYETETGFGWFSASQTLALSTPGVETIEAAEIKAYGGNVNRNNSDSKKEFDPFAFFTGGRRNGGEYVTEAVRQALYPYIFVKQYRRAHT